VRRIRGSDSLPARMATSLYGPVILLTKAAIGLGAAFLLFRWLRPKPKRVRRRRRHHLPVERLS